MLPLWRMESFSKDPGRGSRCLLKCSFLLYHQAPTTITITITIITIDRNDRKGNQTAYE